MEAHYEREEQAPSFKKEATEEVVLSELCNIGVLKAPLRHSLRYTRFSKKRRSCDLMSRLPEYQRLVPIFPVSTNAELQRTKRESCKPKKSS